MTLIRSTFPKQSATVQAERAAAANKTQPHLIDNLRGPITTTWRNGTVIKEFSNGDRIRMRDVPALPN